MIEAMKQWLEALEKSQSALAEELSAWDIDPPLHHVQESHDLCGPAITSLRQAIAELESQEPVATVTSETGADITMSWWHEPALPVGTKLFTHPPQRTWVGLTDEEVVQCQQGNIYHFYRCIEAKLKEKNT
jgi:hypothetical protein